MLTAPLTLTGNLTFSDGSVQTAAASPYVLKNRIINGAMVIDQRYAGTATTNTINSYVVDRFFVAQTNTGKLIAQQNQGSVTPPTGFQNYLGVTSQSSYSILTSDFYVIGQPIEANNISDLAWGTASAQTVTLSFWVYSSLTGTFGGVVKNYAATRSYPFTYTISSANTWTKISITIPGDTSGTWVLSGSGGGMWVQWGLGVGSTYAGTAGSWASANYQGASGSVSVVGTNGATFYITGVQLEIGTSATPFERRLYGQELINCQRYYWKTPTGTTYSHLPCYGYMDTATNAISTVVFPVYMRSSPSFNTSGNFSVICNGAFNISSFSYQGATIETIRIDAASTGMTIGRGCLIRNNNDATAYFEFNAEL
jgi:hypothetical protein